MSSTLKVDRVLSQAQAGERLPRHTRKMRGRGGRERRAKRGEAALRGNCQAIHSESQPVAMTTPSCIVSRNKLLIMDTVFPLPHSPQCPLGCHHYSPLLHMFCICMRVTLKSNTSPEESQGPPSPTPTSLSASLAIMQFCCSDNL